MNGSSNIIFLSIFAAVVLLCLLYFGLELFHMKNKQIENLTGINPFNPTGKSKYIIIACFVLMILVLAVTITILSIRTR